MKAFAQGSASERAEIVDSIRPEYTDALLAFAERMAALGVRENSRQRLLEGLIALLIEGGRVDWREGVRVLAPLYHSATKLGIDPLALFSEAASYSNSETSKVIAEFPDREPQVRSLEAMAYKEEDGTTGFRYVSTLGQL